MVSDWVKKLTEEVVGPSHMEVGKIVQHPDGYKVKIVEGQLWGDDGFSNFWYWKKVNKNGSLSKKIYHGYGW